LTPKRLAQANGLEPLSLCCLPSIVTDYSFIFLMLDSEYIRLKLSFRVVNALHSQIFLRLEDRDIIHYATPVKIW